MKYLVFVAVALASFAPMGVHAEDVKRYSLINEEFFLPPSKVSIRPERSYGYDDGKNIWHFVLSSSGITEPLFTDSTSRSGHRNCNFGHALSVFDGIRGDFPEDTEYHRIWVKNQNRVFSACASAADEAAERMMPVEPAGKDLPLRAATDYKYQLASWHFYKLQFNQALPLYQEVSENVDAPLRPIASYMVVRTLARQGKRMEAYSRIGEILKDKTLKSVFNITENYLFVLGYYPDETDHDLAQVHLEWLRKIVRKNWALSTNLTEGIANFYDAMYQLDLYFPLRDEDTGRVDWWLSDEMPDTPKMRAVKIQSTQDELIDWKQASWAYNLLDEDWLWVLHAENPEYWEQNKNIVDHAWKRWKTGDGLEWLGIVINRIHPDDPLSAAVLKDAREYWVRGWEDETLEYKLWLRNIITNSVRLLLARHEFDDAINLLRVNAEIKDYQVLLHEYQIEKILRWLVYTGEYVHARQVLRFYPKANNGWRVLLAETWGGVMGVAALRKNAYDNGEYLPLFEKMSNALSMQALSDVAVNDWVAPKRRASISRAILTRAMILDDSKHIDQYAILAGENNPEIRAQILAAVSGRDFGKYVDFLLRYPSSPVPFHIDDWWCAYNHRAIEEEIFDEAWQTFSKLPLASKEGEDYRNKFKVFLDMHPYKKLIDMAEVKNLELLPSAPKLLSENVISREYWNSLKFWRGAEAKNHSAENLYYAVRSTRYGCERNGSHAAYSRKAFQVLHDNYGTTIWAKVTPYWFSDKHFR